MKFFAIGLVLILPLLAFSQATTQKPATQQPAKPATGTQQPPRPAPTQQVRPATPAAQQTRPATPATQQTRPVSATQQQADRSAADIEAMKADREDRKLEEPERGGGIPYRELLNEMNRTESRNFSDQELEPRFLSTLLWEITHEGRKEDVHYTDAAEIAAADADATDAKTDEAAARRRNNKSSVLDVYVVTKEYVALYKRGSNGRESSLEMIAKTEGEDMRRNILGKDNSFAAKAPVILIYVSSNKKLSRIPTNKRDFYAAMDCGKATQAAYFFCTSENLVTTTVEVDPIAVGKILKLVADKVLLAQPVGFR